MTRIDLSAPSGPTQSIKRAPWKVDVRDRLNRVREDVEMAVSVNGWIIDSAPDWAAMFREPDNKGSSGPGGNDGSVVISLKAADGGPETAQMRQAQAVVTSTFIYLAETVKTLYQSTGRRQRVLEWFTGGLLLSAYTSLHAAEANRVQLLSSDQLAAQLPAIRQRAAKYLPADDPRLQALQGLPDPNAPTHQALARVQSKLIQNVTTAHTVAQAQQSNPGQPAASNGKVALAVVAPEHPATESAPAPDTAVGTQTGTVTTAEPAPATGTDPDTAADSKIEPATGPASGGGDGQSPPPPPAPPSSDQDLISLTDMLGRDQQVAAMALGEASRAEDQQQAQVRRFRGVLLGIVVGLLAVVGLLIALGAFRASFFPLCLKQVGAKGATTTACPTGGSKASSWDLGFIMAIGGVGAILSVATSLSGLQPTGVRYSLSVAQGLIKIPFGAITAMLGVILLSTQANIGVLATHAGLISTAVVFGYSQQLFTQFIDKRATNLLNQAGGN
jgi:hypothetical protein